MIEPDHPALSIGKQCRLLSISRSSFYYSPLGETDTNLALMLKIDKQFLDTPFYGVRQMTWHLRNEGHPVNEKRIRRLMRLMGLMPIYQAPNGVGHDGREAELFGAENDVADSRDFSEACEADRHHFRFIVSPEDAQALSDLRAFARDLMARAERDLGTRLNWIAVDHWNTDNPHLHILVRGRDEDGRDLVIARDYISRGLRARAETLVQIELGPRSTREIAEGLETQMKAERWTDLDRALRALADDHAGIADLRRGVPGVRDPELRRLMIGRAQVLGRLGLAEQLAPAVWTLKPGAETVLRELGERGDIIKTMHRAMARGPARGAQDFAIEARPETPILGQLVERGLHDEHQGTAYAIVDGVDGRVHHLRFADLDATGDVPAGGIVETRVTLYLVVPPSDISRTKPLVRLILNQIGRRLTETLEPRAHRLLFMLDEFPALGRLDFFETQLAFMAGYGLKAFLIAQSLNQIEKAYGPNNAILDNCHVRVAFATNDERTAKRLSDALGTTTELRAMKNYAGHRLSPWLGHLMVSRQETARALLTPGEIMQLPPEEEIVLVSGTPPIRARKVRYFLDARLNARIVKPPVLGGAVPEDRPHDTWNQLAPVPVDRGTPVSAEDAPEGGIRQEPEVPEHEQVAPAPSPPQQEFAFDDEPDDEPTEAAMLRKQARSVARQAALDPDDGIDL